jgi:hypothetical protein
VFISKRVFIISGVVAVVLVGTISFGLAFAFSHANQAPTTNGTVTPISSVTSKPTGTRACVVGVIQSVLSQSFVVSANQGSRIVTVNVNDQTTYSKNGSQKSLSLTDLVVGDRVRVTAQGQCKRQDTTIVAQSVSVLPPIKVPGVTPTVSPTP